MIDDAEFAAVMAELLSPQHGETDPDFAARTLQLIAAGEMLKAERRRLVRDWLWHMTALAALLASLALLSRMPALAGLPRSGLLAIVSPLALVVALWLFASGVLEPAASRVRRRRPV